MEGLELSAASRRYGRWPWQVKGTGTSATEPGLLQYAVGELIRLIIGGGLAWAAAATSQISGPFGAIAVGAAAPVIIGQLAKGIPLTQPSEEVQPADQPAQMSVGGGN